MTEILKEVSSAIERSQVTRVKAQPFLKWAGGKRSLVPEILRLLPTSFNTYWEPFLGGGAVFFALEGSLRNARLSDINKELMLTYQTVKKQPDKVISLLHKHAKYHASHGKDYYYDVRKNNIELTSEELAANFIFLNKTCYNGLYRVNRNGYFNVPYGKYENPKICDESNLRAVSHALVNADIGFRDFTDIQPSSGDFVYCDPPYDGTYASYDAEGFDDRDQTRLRDHVLRWQQAGAKVMVSNSNTEFIRELYDDFHLHRVNGSRSINRNGSGRGSVTELIITSYDR